ncbi:hypothetical protein ABZ883_04970 [Streptomyces sp. NPDC046977]|uniref:hypothetical protein n=1 Tax=Streptomyces sp. NPDC046977 TaxID=3154703 RepID=UPI0033C95B77
MSRADGRRKMRAFVTYALDGPPKERFCGQAAAAARLRARSANEEQRMPKNSPVEKRAARERQAATGRRYTECLAEIRAEEAERRRQRSAAEAPQ